MKYKYPVFSLKAVMSGLIHINGSQALLTLMEAKPCQSTFIPLSVQNS